VKRYTMKRGKRSIGQCDLLIYEGGTLIFQGSFCNMANELTVQERAIRQAMQFGIETLESEPEKLVSVSR
jgi:hypothetical protein